MVETITVTDYSKVGKKGVPRYFEAYGIEPPTIEIPAKGEGEIVGPSDDPTPKSISRRQFFQYLAIIEVISQEEALLAIAGKEIPAILNSLISSLPEKDQFNAKALVLGATSFDIDNPLSSVIRVLMGWSEEEKRNFWQKASKI